MIPEVYTKTLSLLAKIAYAPEDATWEELLEMAGISQEDVDNLSPELRAELRRFHPELPEPKQET